MARKTDLPFVACIVLAVATAGMAESYVSDIRVALPAESKVSIRWVCPPLDEEARFSEDSLDWFDLRFAVDAAGDPWLASPDDNLIINPVKQYRFSLSHPFSDIFCLDNGALLFQTERDLGFLGMAETPEVRDGKIIVPFQPAISLPLPICRVYPATGDRLYVVGNNPEGEYEVYLLEPETVRADGTKILRSFRKVFQCPEPVAAVAGDGQMTFVAFGSVIARIGRPDQKEPDLIVHPTGTIEDLAYMPEVGLFYATNSTVGVATENGNWDFLDSYSKQIELRGDTLYVLLRDIVGVVAFDHAAELAKYVPVAAADNQKVASAIEAGQIWFEASHEDPDAEDTRGTEFDNETVSYVTGGLTLRATKPIDGKALVTVVWSHFGDSDSDSSVVDLTNAESATVTSSCGVGWTGSGHPSIGPYTMRVLVDGVEIATGSFEMRGTPSTLEAVRGEDTQMLQYMLEQGADPDERQTDSGGATALAWAAGFDLRAVELLLAHGADVNAKDDRNHTPLFFTHLCDSPAMAVEIADSLIRHGADIDVIGDYGYPPLLYEARYGAPEVVELLLKRGANPNAPGKRGNVDSPSLVMLLSNRYHEPQMNRMLELMLSYGANPNARDAAVKDWCPLYLAIEDPEPLYVETLLRYGASLQDSSDSSSSFLYKALQVYLNALTEDRVKAQKAKDVTAILLQHGAALRAHEEAIVADARLHTWLNQELILSVLKRNDQAVLDTIDSTSSAVQRVVVDRLIEMAIAKAAEATSNDGYSAALALCDQAKTRAERWQMQAQCPLIYYNTGLLYRHLGQVAAAKENLRRYLELVPNAPEADAITRMIQ